MILLEFTRECLENRVFQVRFWLNYHKARSSCTRGLKCEISIYFQERDYLEKLGMIEKYLLVVVIVADRSVAEHFSTVEHDCCSGSRRARQVNLECEESGALSCRGRFTRW